MDYYKGIVPGKDEPKNGGSYVKDTKDAHEKYNFKPEHLKLKGFPEGEYCLGLMFLVRTVEKSIFIMTLLLPKMS